MTAVLGNWFEAAEQPGHNRRQAAQYNLALMHELGRGVAKDESKAAAMYAVAAEDGHVKAQFNLYVVPEYSSRFGLFVHCSRASQRSKPERSRPPTHHPLTTDDRLQGPPGVGR